MAPRWGHTAEHSWKVPSASRWAAQTVVFDSDKRVSRLMTRTDFKDRSILGKMFDAVAGVFRQQL
jgi:hypothetical protein